MSFLNPFFFIGSLMLAVPVIIHLVRREKSEIVPFSSLMFLLKVPKRSIRQQILKNLLLMALRVLLLALLVGAFARPYFTQSAKPNVPLGSERSVVMLLDDSYSMRYGGNFDRMKAEAVKRIDSLAAGDRMALLAFNDSASVLMLPTSDKNQLKGAVSALEPSYNGTRYYEAFSLADRVLGQTTGAKQLVMISDFQRTGWNRSSRESIIGRDVKTEMVNLGVEQSNNVGIDSVSVDSTTFNRTYNGRVIARIHNYRRDQAVTTPVSLKIDDKEVDRRTVTVSANGTALAEFTNFDLPKLGFSKGKVRIEAEDPLPVDNEFLFSIERREKLNVLIIDAGRPKQSVYLQTAFTASSDLPFAVTVANGQNVTPEQLGSQQVIIVNDAIRLPDRVRDRLGELRKTGQGQLVILGENADLSWWAGFPGMPAKPTQKIFVQKDRGRAAYSVTTVNRNHSIFKPFQNSAVFSLSAAQFMAYTEMEPKQGATILAKFENGSPAFVEAASEDGGLLVFASAVDNPQRGWSDLPLKASFISLFTEIVRYLSRYNDLHGWYPLGEGIPIVGGRENAGAAVIKPNGDRQSLGELGPGEQKFFTPTTPGFHELRVGRDTRVVAVNPPSNEGNLDRMPPEDLLASVQRTEGEGQQAGLFSQDEQADYARRQMGWWYLLMIALMAVIAEIYIANTGQRVQAAAPGRRP
jgi:hypothetical protein